MYQLVVARNPSEQMFFVGAKRCDPEPARVIRRAGRVRLSSELACGRCTELRFGREIAPHLVVLNETSREPWEVEFGALHPEFGEVAINEPAAVELAAF